MTAAARRDTATSADDSGPVAAHPLRRASDRNPPQDIRGWLVLAVGFVGVISGGLGSLASSSYGHGENAKRLDVLEVAVRDHGATLRDHAALVGAFSTRMAVVEANVLTIKESTARIEQAMRDERNERRATDKGGTR